MRRTASEVLSDLEIRVARLEKEAILGLFRGKKPTIKSEEDLLKKSIGGLRGISEVSVDLSDEKNLEMVITYEGEDFYYRGRCLVDNYGIYGGSKTASSNLIFQSVRNDRSRRNRGRGVGTGILNLDTIKGNKYRFGVDIELITEKGRVVEGLDSLYRDIKSYYEGRRREEKRKEELAFKQQQRELSERARLDREERKRRRREQLSRYARLERKSSLRVASTLPSLVLNGRDYTPILEELYHERDGMTTDREINLILSEIKSDVQQEYGFVPDRFTDYLEDWFGEFGGMSTLRDLHGIIGSMNKTLRSL